MALLVSLSGCICTWLIDVDKLVLLGHGFDVKKIEYIVVQYLRYLNMVIIFFLFCFFST